MRYVFDGSRRIARIGVAQPYEQTQATTPLSRLVFVGDHLGSTSVVVQDNEDPAASGSELGCVVSSTSHLPYGGSEAESGAEGCGVAVDEAYRFTGKEEESGLGVYYFGARYYNPALANFVSVDAMSLFANSGEHPYLYVGGNPYKYVDPDGNKRKPKTEDKPEDGDQDIDPVPTQESAPMAPPSYPSEPSEPEGERKDREGPPRAPCPKNLRICDRKAAEHGGTRQVTPEEAARYDRQAKAQKRRARKRNARKKAATGAWGLFDFIVGVPRKSEDIEAHKSTAKAAIAGDPEALVAVGTAILVGVLTRRLAPRTGPKPGPRGRGSGRGGSQCFAVGTLVKTDSKEVRIENVSVGDLVWSYNRTTNSWRLGKVERVYRHQYQGQMVTIRVEGRTIQATENHPFWVVSGDRLSQRRLASDVPSHERDCTSSGRWVEAGDLRVGDKLLAAGGNLVRIDSLSHRFVRQVVYNIQVRGTRTYSVSSLGVAVHNKDPGVTGGGGRISGGRKPDIKAIDRVAKELKLSRGQRRMLHDEISGQGLSMREIKDIALDIARNNPNK
jgi:RHS repeat-associated protein